MGPGSGSAHPMIGVRKRVFRLNIAHFKGRLDGPGWRQAATARGRLARNLRQPELIGIRARGPGGVPAVTGHGDRCDRARRSSSGLEKPSRHLQRLHPIVHFEFLENMRQVVPDRTRFDVQRVGNLFIGQSLANAGQHLLLAVGELG